MTTESKESTLERESWKEPLNVFGRLVSHFLLISCVHTAIFFSPHSHVDYEKVELSNKKYNNLYKNRDGSLNMYGCGGYVYDTNSDGSADYLRIGKFGGFVKGDSFRKEVPDSLKSEYRETYHNSKFSDKSVEE